MSIQEAQKLVKSYSVPPAQFVKIEIVESLEGKYRYIVRTPELSDIGKKILDTAMDKILHDVKLLAMFSEALTLDEGMDLAMKVLDRLAKKYIKKGKISQDEVKAIAYYIAREFVGYGALDPLLRDPHIEDITCDGVGIPVYVFHNEYEWLETNVVFATPEELERIIRKLANRAGIEPTIARPIVEGVIRPEGYRVHIVLDTVSRRGHSFTIRRFREMPFTIVELINRRMLDAGLAALLWLVAENRQGIVIYGPTGAGKTTLLNAIAMLLPPEVKIVTAEDTPEIVLPFHDNWVAMVTRLSTDPAVQSVSLQAQVESALRQRPDILILGEIRSREAYSFFQAVSTGHGGLTTVHAESVESLIRRLVAPPMNVPKSLIATVKLFIEVLRILLPSGVARKVVVVHEVRDYDASRDAICIGLLSKWDREHDEWRVNLYKSSALRAIADLLALEYSSVVEDLIMRATVLEYAARKNLDIVALHTLIRRYRRNSKEVFSLAVKEIGRPYEVKQLEQDEVKWI